MPGTWFGSGGVTAEVPSRTYPQQGTTTPAPDYTGGARGPAAIPSRATKPVPPAKPQMTNPRGPVAIHRGTFVEDAGAPRLLATGEFAHDLLPWNRPRYRNVQGRLRYVPPVDVVPSWTANRPNAPALVPAVAIPVGTRSIANFMVRETFGADRQLFPGGSLAGFVSRIQRGLSLEGRGWARRAKFTNPITTNLSTYGHAGSYGQTTRTLLTAPTNLPVGSSTPYGSY